MLSQAMSSFTQSQLIEPSFLQAETDAVDAAVEAEPIETEQLVDYENDLFKKSFLNIDPTSAFLMNEVLGLLFIAFFQMNRFLFNNKGNHDTFLWLAHTGLWAQNQFFWLATNLFDSILMREVYQKSTFIVGVIPYVIMPMYLLWTIA